jgi:hypothetical protein
MDWFKGTFKGSPHISMETPRYPVKVFPETNPLTDVVV